MNAIEALLNDLSESPEERETMGFALRLLAWAPAPLDPPFGLCERIEAAVHQPAGAHFAGDGANLARASLIEWQPLAEGVTCKALHDGSEASGRASLIRVEPNCPFPRDDGEPEHIYLLEGELWVGQIQMRAGDYSHTPAGTAHPEIRAGRAGALFVLVTR